MPAAAAPVGGGRRASAPTAPGLIRLSRVSLFAGLSPARLAWLEKRLLVVRWHYGTVRPTALVRPDHLYVVREGRLALFERAASGHQVMIAVLDPGSIYSTLGDVDAPDVDALEDVAVSPLAAPALEALVAREPRLAWNWPRRSPSASPCCGPPPPSWPRCGWRTASARACSSWPGATVWRPPSARASTWV